jgi:hypothetical protein
LEREVGREQLEDFVEIIFDEEIHAKRVVSLIDGVDGVLHSHLGHSGHRAGLLGWEEAGGVA